MWLSAAGGNRERAAERPGACRARSAGGQSPLATKARRPVVVCLAQNRARVAVLWSSAC